MSEHKKSFRSTEWPPLSFYHRIGRVIIGTIILVASGYQIYVSFFYFLLLAFISSSVKYPAAITSSESGYAAIGLFIFVISNIVWIVAALKLILKAVYRNSALATICALAGTVPFAAFGSVFIEPSLPLWSVLVPTIAVSHLALAIGTIYFSKRSRPAFHYRFRDDAAGGSQGDNAIKTDKN